MTNLHNAVRPKSYSEMVGDWNLLAKERHRQIASGDDISFHHVIVPTALGLLERCDRDCVLDIGSGTGEFTVKLAEVSKRVIAVEPSRTSVKIAKSISNSNNNVNIFESVLERIADKLTEFGVTCAIANMSLMTAPKLPDVVQAIDKVLPVGGNVVATIPHPVFWPRYRGYEGESWYKYNKEIFVEAQFCISKSSTDFLTTHIHRPLEQYLAVFSDFGFFLDTLVEPVPNVEIERLYPDPWKFPRFVGLKWTKILES